MNIVEWMIANKITENGIAGNHIVTGLKLNGLPREKQEALCILYRRWRPKTDKKNDIPAWQAYQLAIAGIDPDNVHPRQIDMELLLQDLADHG